MGNKIITQWRDIPNTDGLYQASNDGEIRSIDTIIEKMNRWGSVSMIKKRGRVLKPWRDSNGYLVVYICGYDRREAKNVHRLVAMAFHGIPDKRKDVNHIDGNKQNNVLSNLEWCTKKENMAHARRIGLHDPTAKRPPAHNRKRIVGIPVNGGECIYSGSSREAAAMITKNPNGHGNIRSAATGKLRQAYGYFWKYA